MFAQVLVDVVLPVFAIVGVGALLARSGGFDVGSISTLLLNASLPALALDRLTKYHPTPAALGRVAAGALCVSAVLGLVSYLVARRARLPVRGVVLTSTFMNAGNFGMPLALLAWGEAALALAVLYYLTMQVATNTVGIWIAQGSGSGWRELTRHPVVYAAAFGLALSWSGGELPAFVVEPVHMLAETSVPLMLLSLGATLQTIKPRELVAATTATVLRLGGGFALALSYVALTGAQGDLRRVLILSSTMPSAVLNVVLAQRYQADPEVVATAVLISTLASLATVPLVITWLG